MIRGRTDRPVAEFAADSVSLVDVRCSRFDSSTILVFRWSFCFVGIFLIYSNLCMVIINPKTRFVFSVSSSKFHYLLLYKYVVTIEPCMKNIAAAPSISQQVGI